MKIQFLNCNCANCTVQKFMTDK